MTDGRVLPVERMTRQLDEAVEVLHVPEFLRADQANGGMMEGQTKNGS